MPGAQSPGADELPVEQDQGAHRRTVLGDQQLIGYSGNTGLSGACHLHFEVYVGGKTVDPAPLLGLR